MTFFTVVIRGLLRRPVHTCLTLAGISIGIAAVDETRNPDEQRSEARLTAPDQAAPHQDDNRPGLPGALA